MDYGRLLNQAWNVIWKYKFMMILGILVALSSGVGSSTSGGGNMLYGFDSQNQGMTFIAPETFIDPATPMWLVLLLVGLGLILALILWVISTIARGGLIAGANAAEFSLNTNFSQAWGAGWNRVWTLVGIAIIPAIPIVFLLLLSGLGLVAYLNNTSEAIGVPVRSNLTILIGTLACLAIPAAIVLEIFRVFANRACILKGTGVIDSYRHGSQVLIQNLGQALVLFLIQIAVTIAMIVLFFVPGLILALCCLLWPVLILFQGAVTAYFSTMWTLAWNQWTNETPAIDELVAPA